MSSRLRVCYRGEKGKLAALTADDRPLWLDKTSRVLSADLRKSAVGILSISSRDGAIGVALVPDELENAATLNGAPLRAGLHTVRHTDRLDVQGQSLWFAASSAVEPSTYDPAIHGENVFCFLTKARLAVGAAIVVCPGAPGTTCKEIYTARAWELAMNSSSMRKCASCGFRPDESEWLPTESQRPGKIDELLNSLTDNHV